MQDWLKLHTDLLDNPDVALMSAEDYQIATFLWMLCRKEGFTDGRLIGWDFARLAFRFRKSIDDVTQSVTRLCNADLRWCNVDCNGVICVTRYTERQYGKKSSSPGAVRERVKRFRNRQKEAKQNPAPIENVTRNADVTPCNTVIEEKRLEEIRIEEIKESAGADAPPPPDEPTEKNSNEQTRTKPDDSLLISLTEGGQTLLKKYESLAAEKGKTSRLKHYKNERQRRAFEAVYRKLNGELADLIDKGFARERTGVSNMLAWLEGCVQRAKTPQQSYSQRPAKQTSSEYERRWAEHAAKRNAAKEKT